LNRYAPSKADTSVFDALGKAPSAEYANIARWYRNISSYSANERNGWAGSAVPQVSGGTTTTPGNFPSINTHFSCCF
jgi:elongation factor 1-beta